MNVLEQTQQKRRFWFYIAFTAVCMLISFWAGYRLGREVEKDAQPTIDPAQTQLSQHFDLW